MIKNHFLFKSKFNLALLIVVLVQVVLMFQGFDICDDGFVLTYYQQIFTHPESVEYNFLYWFSGILGGIWYRLFEDGGILWFRILGVILNTATFIISYKILKKYVSELVLILALTMVLFVNDYGFLTFYHNQITSFFTVLMIYLLSRALFKDKSMLLVFAGFIYVLNGLTRLPNFVLGCLFLAIPVYYYLNKTSLKASLKPIGFCVFGVLSGCLFVWVLLFVTGQLQVMENAIYTMMDVGKTEGSSHNFKSVLMAQYYNFYNILMAFGEVLVVTIPTILALKICYKNKIIVYAIYIVFMALMLYWFQKNGIFSIYTLAYIGAVWFVLSKNADIKLRVVAFMAFLMLLTMSLGSGGGIKNSGFMAIWLGFPLFYLSFPLITKRLNLVLDFFNIEEKENSNNVSKSLIYVISIVFLLLKAYHISDGAYFDPGSRLDKRFVINNIKARYIYTTERRAEIVNNLLNNLEDYVKPEDYLFAYDHIPMIHFLTETKPYTYNSWPGIYDHYSFDKKIRKAESTIKDLPIVVIQKFETIIDFSEPRPNYMIPEENTAILHGSKSISLMNAFLERHQYKEVWSDNYFIIYKSYSASKRVN